MIVLAQPIPQSVDDLPSKCSIPSQDHVFTTLSISKHSNHLIWSWSIVSCSRTNNFSNAVPTSNLRPNWISQQTNNTDTRRRNTACTTKKEMRNSVVLSLILSTICTQLHGYGWQKFYVLHSTLKEKHNYEEYEQTKKTILPMVGRWTVNFWIVSKIVTVYILMYDKNTDQKLWKIRWIADHMFFECTVISRSYLKIF